MSEKTIEKTIFAGMGDEQKLTAFKEWLADSDLFDSVELDSTTVKCYVGERLAFAFWKTESYHSAYLKNGYEWKMGDFNISQLSYGVKTSKGIYIQAQQSYKMHIFITKSNNGDIVALRNYNKEDVEVPDLEKSPANVSGVYEWNVPSSCLVKQEITSLSPIPSYGTNTYPVGLYLLVFNQYPDEEATITVNGKRYYSNGFIALEE
jgi:hypothetical protein